MKKVLFGLAVVAAAAFGVYTANKDIAGAQMSDLQVENIELLAEAEPGENDCFKVCVKDRGFYCAIAYTTNLSEVYYCLDYIKSSRLQ